MDHKIECTAPALFLRAFAAHAQSPTFEVGLSTGAILSAGKNDIYLLGLLRPGYFITPGLEVEAELGTFGSIYFDGLMAVYGAGNLEYNFSLSSSVSPFLLAGYGMTCRFKGHEQSENINVVNLGAGLKFNFWNPLGFRVEDRFQHWSGDQAYDEVTGPIDRPYSVSRIPAVDDPFHSLVVGAGILL